MLKTLLDNVEAFQLGSAYGFDVLGQLEPMDPDAPDEVKAPIRKIGSLVKWVVIAVLTIGGGASLANVVKSMRQHEPSAAGFTGVGLAAVAIGILLKIETIFGWIAA